MIIQLYGQCMVNVTAFFVYRYQKVGENKKKSYYGVMLGVACLCKFDFFEAFLWQKANVFASLF